MARIKKPGGKAGTKKSKKTLSRVAARALKKSAAGNHAKVRHMRDRRGQLHDWAAVLPTGLIAKPIRAQATSKHRSYFEFVENTDKKKKLEFQVTKQREPPPGYEFVPIGNPALTAACKELSREQEAMIFIVSSYSREPEAPGSDLGLALNRVGHHIRELIVEQARESLGDMADMPLQAQLDIPEPIPRDQEEINKQADAAIRDLFPRIPNTDRQTIIEHSFKKGAKARDGMPLVGLAPDLTLSRRVQLAVISHIRHTHTRYDQLLRETTWANARRAVEELCLDILVKWRGDEENGRDQLDEILREVVVISDSEDDYEDDDDDDDDDDEDTDMTSGESSDNSDASTGERPPVAEQHASASGSRPYPQPAAVTIRLPAIQDPCEAERVKAAAKRAHRGFQRYQAVRDQAWQQAINRQRQGHNCAPSGSISAAMSRPQSQAPQRHREPETYHQPYGAERGDGAGPSDYQTHRVPSSNTAPPSGASRDAHLTHAYRNSLDHVIASRPQTPAYYLDNGEGQRNAENAGNGYQPTVGSRPAFCPSPGVRTVVSRPPPEVLKDYLVPSIEPTSPLASQFSAQTLEDDRQDRPSEQWQSRSALQLGNEGPRYAPASQFPVEGFIRVHRPNGEFGRAEPMPSAYRPVGTLGPRDSGLIRSEARETTPHRPVTVANLSYRRSHAAPLARNDYIPAEVTYSRQEDVHFRLAQDRRAAHEAVPEASRHSTVQDDGSGACYRDATRPIIDDNRTPRGEYRPYAAPIPDNGSSTRYSDASRPIIVDNERRWRDPQRSYNPPPVRVQDAPEQLPVLRQTAVAPQEYGIRTASRVDQYQVGHRPPLDFYPVSNMFPRPHEPSSRRPETRIYTGSYLRGAPMDVASPGVTTGNVYDQRYVHSVPEARANLPRQERVVRYEYVDHGRENEGQGQRMYDHENVYRPQDPSEVASAPPGVAYGATPVPRHSRQDSVIYLG